MGINILPSIVLALLYVYGADSAVFTVKNNCGSTVSVSAITGSGAPVPTGFALAPQASKTLNVSPPWSGRLSGGTTPPASLAEFTVGGANNLDFYDISLVDGFNLPISIKPDGAGCQTTSCSANVNSGCPNELAVKGPNGAVVGCKSACLAFNQPQYCCTGAFNNPGTCKPTNYSQIFKKQCPQAYSYAYDDKTSTFTCTTGANYAITFCP